MQRWVRPAPERHRLISKRQAVIDICETLCGLSQFLLFLNINMDLGGFTRGNSWPQQTFYLSARSWCINTNPVVVLLILFYFLIIFPFLPRRIETGHVEPLDLFLLLSEGNRSDLLTHRNASKMQAQRTRRKLGRHPWPFKALVASQLQYELQVVSFKVIFHFLGRRRDFYDLAKMWWGWNSHMVSLAQTLNSRVKPPCFWEEFSWLPSVVSCKSKAFIGGRDGSCEHVNLSNSTEEVVPLAGQAVTLCSAGCILSTLPIQPTEPITSSISDTCPWRPGVKLIPNGHLLLLSGDSGRADFL